MGSLTNPFPIERTETEDGRRLLRFDTGGGSWFDVGQARKTIADLQDAIEWAEQGQ